MADPEEVLARLVGDALGASLGPDYAAADPLIRPSQFADFQANVALSLARRLNRAPREVAAEVASHLAGREELAQVEVSGPGFVNLTLRDDWIAAQATGLLDNPRLGVPVAEPAQK